MKCEVKCYVAGQVFNVECYAKDYDDARKVAMAQHPNATIIGVTAKYGKVE
tara:strand:+ start:278 stop:430 length:153 start_codon:yes stop_codon:yes gene_type:complete